MTAWVPDSKLARWLFVVVVAVAVMYLIVGFAEAFVSMLNPVIVVMIVVNNMMIQEAVKSTIVRGTAMNTVPNAKLTDVTDVEDIVGMNVPAGVEVAHALLQIARDIHRSDHPQRHHHISL
jgi:hypothetical protein